MASIAELYERAKRKWPEQDFGPDDSMIASAIRDPSGAASRLWGAFVGGVPTMQDDPYTQLYKSTGTLAGMINPVGRQMPGTLAAIRSGKPSLKDLLNTPATTVTRGRFNWEVADDAGNILGKYSLGIPQKDVLGYHAAEIEKMASEKAAKSERAKASAAQQKTEQATLADLAKVYEQYGADIGKMHNIRNIEFQSMNPADFASKATMLLHQSPNYGKKQGSAYKLVMIDGRPAYAREADHWGPFSTTTRGVGETEPAMMPGDAYDPEWGGTLYRNFNWTHPEQETTGWGKKNRLAGYAFIDDLLAKMK